MPHYSYEAFDRDGVRRAGALAAATREGALEVLTRRGQIPIALTEGRPATDVAWWQRELFGGGGLPLPAMAMFTRELTALIKADIPIDDALRLVAMQPLIPARVRKTTTSVLGLVTEGEALSDALAAQGKTFPEFYWRLVRAGEASGSLGPVLDDLTVFLDSSVETRGRVGAALMYPAVLIVAALGAVAVIMTVLLPTITPLFQEAGATPPFLVRVLGRVSVFLSGNAYGIAAAILALIIAAAVALQNARARMALDRILLRLPIAGPLIERRDTGRLARTLATLIKNSVPIVDAVRISASVLSNRVLAEAVRGAGDEIQEGGVLSAPLARSGLFSDLFLRLTSIGEQTGQLDTMLQRTAEIYESALKRQIQRLTSLITPVVTLVIGGVVGGLLVTVMSALISVNDLALK